MGTARTRARTSGAIPAPRPAVGVAAGRLSPSRRRRSPARSSAGSTTCVRPSSNAPSWARTAHRRSRTGPAGACRRQTRPDRRHSPSRVRRESRPVRAAVRRSPRRRRPRPRVNRAVPPPVDRSTGPGPGRRRQRVVARTTGHPPPAPRPGSRRAAACSRCPAPALPYHSRHPLLARAVVARPARRGLVRHPTRPAARPVRAVRPPLPAHPWAHRPQAPRLVVARTPPLRRRVVRMPLFRRAVIRTPPHPAVIPTPCHRCAVRMPVRRSADPARSNRSNPAVPGRPPTARPPVAAPPARHPTRRGPPEHPPPPARPASTARRLASCRRPRTACGPTPPSTVTRVPPGVVRARPTPVHPSPPGALRRVPVRQPAGVVAPPNPTSRWCPARGTRHPCPARGTHRRCPRRPARTVAPCPPPAPPTAPFAAGSSPVKRNAERRPAANPAWTGRTARSGPRTGSARPAACHTPTPACRWSTAETAVRRPGVTVRRRPSGRETSPTRRPVDSPCPTRPRNAPPPAGPPARRSTRARTHRPVAAPPAPTRRDPPESRP
ncbi:hypothetical protein MED15_02849 [Micromonospora noduli]|uniref:Basic proline-rich protein n=1 Tax=Micromonospora noduli TaxID=709876 RepID=A0ABX9D2F0_9ACTN|nr:hypothetical protein MED15_02849 [Micromonospora noduli]